MTHKFWMKPCNRGVNSKTEKGYLLHPRKMSMSCIIKMQVLNTQGLCDNLAKWET